MSDSEEDLHAALALSLEGGGETGGLAEDGGDGGSASSRRDEFVRDYDCEPLTEAERQAICGLMWSNRTTKEDMSRWMSQGISLNSSPGDDIPVVPSTAGEERWCSLLGGAERWGLRQTAGGPCGVLAAVQCEMIRRLIGTFDDGESTAGVDRPAAPTTEWALSMAIGTILARCALAEVSDERTPATSTSARPRRVRIVMPVARGMPTPPGPPPAGGDVFTVALPPRRKRGRQQREWDGTSAGEPAPPPPAPDTSADDDDERALACAVASFLLAASPRAVEDSMLAPEKQVVPATPLSLFSRPGGVLHLASSLILTRTARSVREDTDDGGGGSPSGDASSSSAGVDGELFTLTGQFGHCNQELINLLLCGCATSNVFDGTVDMGGGFVVGGIPRRCPIGYLTELESLRYCSVGSFYKTPKYPIWVVGSQSHFSVLFGMDMSSITESTSDGVLRKCRGAFMTVDTAANGFIEVCALDKVLSKIPTLYNSIGGPNNVPTLAASLEISGAGIILWDDFWRSASRLMTGASLATILGEAVAEEVKNEAVEMGVAGGSGLNSLIDSDAAMAREMAAEWDVAPNPWQNQLTPPKKGGDTDVVTSFDIDTAQSGDATKSDEVIARELQAQWDAEARESTAVALTGMMDGDPISSFIENPREDMVLSSTPTGVEGGLVSDFLASDDKMEVSPVPTIVDRTDPPTVEGGNTFELVYYNGLRGGQVCSFSVTKQAKEAVGASVALSDGTSAAGGGGHGNCHKLEDIVRTRWPGCTFDWYGKIPPSVD